MMEEVRKRFLPRFTALARERVARARDVADAPGGDAGAGEEVLHLAREFHSLAGEAGLLGLGDLITVARAAEEAAVQLHDDRSRDRVAALHAALEVLEQALEAVQPHLDS